ncbi:MAG: preprotein translocase subunit YajC [Clostridia bacterium]|nr:preprotein translocase subunit YajC [Clostridia bacterium]
MIKNWLFGITSAMAETAAAAPAAGEAMPEINPVAQLLTMLLPLVLMGLVFYFMLIRPQRKKDKKVKEMLDNLKAGDRITTIGGIYGTILNIKDETITLAIGQKNGAPTEMTVARWAIRQVEEVTVENDGEVLA